MSLPPALCPSPLLPLACTPGTQRLRHDRFAVGYHLLCGVCYGFNSDDANSDANSDDSDEVTD